MPRIAVEVNHHLCGSSEAGDELGFSRVLVAAGGMDFHWDRELPIDCELGIVVLTGFLESDDFYVGLHKGRVQEEGGEW
jgi:hypothetical protein